MLFQGPSSFSVVVPEGAQPGTAFHHTTEDGSSLELTVPQGVYPGYTLRLQRCLETGKLSCTAVIAPETAELPVEEPFQDSGCREEEDAAMSAEDAAQRELEQILAEVQNAQARATTEAVENIRNEVLQRWNSEDDMAEFVCDTPLQENTAMGETRVDAVEAPSYVGEQQQRSAVSANRDVSNVEAARAATDEVVLAVDGCEEAIEAVTLVNDVAASPADLALPPPVVGHPLAHARAVEPPTPLRVCSHRSLLSGATSQRSSSRHVSFSLHSQAGDESDVSDDDEADGNGLSALGALGWKGLGGRLGLTELSRDGLAEAVFEVRSRLGLASSSEHTQDTRETDCIRRPATGFKIGDGILMRATVTYQTYELKQGLCGAILNFSDLGHAWVAWSDGQQKWLRKEELSQAMLVNEAGKSWLAACRSGQRAPFSTNTSKRAPVPRQQPQSHSCMPPRSNTFASSVVVRQHTVYAPPQLMTTGSLGMVATGATLLPSPRGMVATGGTVLPSPRQPCVLRPAIALANPPVLPTLLSRPRASVGMHGPVKGFENTSKGDFGINA